MILNKRCIAVLLIISTVFLFFSSGNISVVLGLDFLDGLRNIPNPFSAGNEETDIYYYISEECTVSIRIYNLIGDMVKTYGESECNGSSGINSKAWDGRNGVGRAVADGCYICLVSATNNDGIVNMKMLKIAVMEEK